jgi:hypothetical protein
MIAAFACLLSSLPYVVCGMELTVVRYENDLNHGWCHEPMCEKQVGNTRWEQQT